MLKMPGGHVYLMMNKGNTVIYTGVTSDLQERVYQHREGLVEGFTRKYNVKKLVYYEIADNIEAAILREKQIKAGSRKKKINLIKSVNPGFTPQPESHIRKGMDEWLSGGIPLHGRRRNPETKEAMAVRPWSFTDLYPDIIG
jgi:putative endonuclease